MCDDIAAADAAPAPTSTGLSRRGLLSAAAAGALAATAGGLAFAPTRAGAAATAAPKAAGDGRGLSVTLLGTAAGPPPQSARAGIATALVVDGKTYMVDCGRGAVTQFMRGGLSMPSLTGIFLTHLHADHTVDYFSFPLLAAGVVGPQGFQTPIGVWGPGSAHLPSRLVGSTGTTLGTVEMTARANRTFEASTTFFLDEHFGVDPMTMLDVHDVLPPASVGASPANPAPAMKPFDVMEDDRVKVTAILVPHGSVWPSYAYRFDTEHGSVVFSGDTARTPNIPTLAHGADLLLHETADFSILPEAGYPPAVIDHIKLVHTDVAELGAVAKESDVRKLVATHITPVNPDLMPDAEWRKKLRASAKTAGYTGDLVLGMDLMQIPVGR